MGTLDWDDEEVSMERIKVLFPELSPSQWDLLGRMAILHREWNTKINLVSRKDIDNLEWHHYAPCIAAVKLLGLGPGNRLLDVGTGGGFPGLILAVLFPEAHFTLADSVGKKVGVVQDIANRLALPNVEARHVRVETLREPFDIVTGRAVTSLPGFMRLVRGRIRKGASNGVVYWKGGSLQAEEETLGIAPVEVLSLEELLGDSYFHEKFIVRYRQEDLSRCRDLPETMTGG